MKCTKCLGNGYTEEECELCGRDGWVDDPDDDGTMTCLECDGEAGNICNHCDNGFAYDEDDDAHIY